MSIQLFSNLKFSTPNYQIGKDYATKFLTNFAPYIERYALEANGFSVEMLSHEAQAEDLISDYPLADIVINYVVESGDVSALEVRISGGEVVSSRELDLTN